MTTAAAASQVTMETDQQMLKRTAAGGRESIQDWLKTISPTHDREEKAVDEAGSQSVPRPPKSPVSAAAAPAKPAATDDDLSLGAEARTMKLTEGAIDVNGSSDRKVAGVLRLKFAKTPMQSFNSDWSKNSYDSVEQMLQERLGDPEEILANLGFAGMNTDEVNFHRIPQRFIFSSSSANGINIPQVLESNPTWREFMPEEEATEQVTDDSDNIALTPGSQHTKSFGDVSMTAMLVNRFAHNARFAAAKRLALEGNRHLLRARVMPGKTSRGERFSSILHPDNTRYRNQHGYYDSRGGRTGVKTSRFAKAARMTCMSDVVSALKQRSKDEQPDEVTEGLSQNTTEVKVDNHGSTEPIEEPTITDNCSCNGGTHSVDNKLPSNTNCSNNLSCNQNHDHVDSTMYIKASHQTSLTKQPSILDDIDLDMNSNECKHPHDLKMTLESSDAPNPPLLDQEEIQCHSDSERKVDQREKPGRAKRNCIPEVIDPRKVIQTKAPYLSDVVQQSFEMEEIQSADLMNEAPTTVACGDQSTSDDHQIKADLVRSASVQSDSSGFADTDHLSYERTTAEDVNEPLTSPGSEVKSSDTTTCGPHNCQSSSQTPPQSSSPTLLQQIKAIPEIVKSEIQGACNQFSTRLKKKTEPMAVGSDDDGEEDVGSNELGSKGSGSKESGSNELGSKESGSKGSGSKESGSKVSESNDDHNVNGVKDREANSLPGTEAEVHGSDVVINGCNQGNATEKHMGHIDGGMCQEVIEPRASLGNTSASMSTTKPPDTGRFSVGEDWNMVEGLPHWNKAEVLMKRSYYKHGASIRQGRLKVKSISPNQKSHPARETDDLSPLTNDSGIHKSHQEMSYGHNQSPRSQEGDFTQSLPDSIDLCHDHCIQNTSSQTDHRDQLDIAAMTQSTPILRSRSSCEDGVSDYRVLRYLMRSPCDLTLDEQSEMMDAGSAPSSLQQHLLSEVRIMQQALQKYKLELRALELRSSAAYHSCLLSEQLSGELEEVTMLRRALATEVGETEALLDARLRFVLSMGAGDCPPAPMDLASISVIHTMVELLKEQTYHSSIVAGLSVDLKPSPSPDLHDQLSLLQEQLHQSSTHTEQTLNTSLQELRGSLVEEIRGSIQAETQQLRRQVAAAEAQLALLQQQMIASQHNTTPPADTDNQRATSTAVS